MAGNGGFIEDTREGAIIGGCTNYLSGTSRSVIIGGQHITGITEDTAYVPNLNIDYQPDNDNTLSQLLVRDETTGTVKYRDASSISGGGGSFTGNTSGDCITDLWVSNIHSCSPLYINPGDEGIVEFGSSGDVYIDVVDESVHSNDFHVAHRLIHEGDDNTFIWFTPDRIRIEAGGTEFICIQDNPPGGATGELAINEGGVQMITRVEGVHNENLLFINGLTNVECVGIGNSGRTDTLFHINSVPHPTTGYIYPFSVQGTNGYLEFDDKSSISVPRLRITGSTTGFTSFAASADESPQGLGINMGVLGKNRLVDFHGYGDPGDAVFYASAGINNLNIINQQASATSKTDDINFYAGENAGAPTVPLSGKTPNLHIHGRTVGDSLKSFIGVNTRTPTERLHVQDGNLQVVHDHDDDTKIRVYNIDAGTSARTLIALTNRGIGGVDTSGLICYMGANFSSTALADFQGEFLPNSLNITTAGGGVSQRAHINIGSRSNTGETRFFSGGDDFNSGNLLGRFFTSGLTITDMTNTDTLRVRNNATTGYVLTATDSLGNASWQESSGSGTFTGNTSGTCIDLLWVSTISGCSPVTIGSSIQSEGSTASGFGSIAYGFNTLAMGSGSHAEGSDTIATGLTSHAEGNITNAWGDYSHAEGANTFARGSSAHAEGEGSDGAGDYSHAEGLGTQAIGDASHSEGSSSIARGEASHAEGADTTSSGITAHAEGTETKSWGDYSHSEGFNTLARGMGSHAEGGYTEDDGPLSIGTSAKGDSSHAEGYGTLAMGNASHAEGWKTIAGPAGVAHAEGFETVASGSTSHAEGYQTIASGDQGSHAEGYQTIASGDQASHAEGYETIASGELGCHAEGYLTEATADSAHAEGQTTEANKAAAHAEGISTTASGLASHAEGGNTIASGASSHSSGSYTTAGGINSYAGGRGINSSSRIEAIGSNSFAHFSIGETPTTLGVWGTNSAILGGEDHKIGGVGGNSIIIGGGANFLDNANGSGIFAGSFNNINGIASTNYNTIMGGSHNLITGTTSSNYNSIVGGLANIVTGPSVHSSIVVGGAGNKINGRGFGTANSIIVGGYLNRVKGPTLVGNSDNNVVIGGQQNTISPAVGFNNNTILSGFRNNIEGRVTGSAIIGGSSNDLDVSGIQNSVIVGGQNSSMDPSVVNSVILGGSALNATTSNTAYVPHLNIDILDSDTPFVNLSVNSDGTAVSGFSWSDPSVISGNTSVDCITELFVSTITPCSPLTISPGNEGNVHLGEQGGAPIITLDILTPDEPGILIGEDSFIRWKESEKKLIIGEEEVGGKVVIEVEEDEIVDITKEKTKIVEGDLETEDGDIIVKSGNSKTIIIEDLPDVAGADLSTDMDGKIIDEPSDSKVKENLKPLDTVVNVLEFLKNIKGYQFTWSTISRIGDPNKKHYGFMVDHFRDNLVDPAGQNFSSDHLECNEIGKSMVRPNRTKFRIAGSSQPQQVDSLSYTEMIPFIVEGLKAVDFKVENLTLGDLGADVFLEKGEYDDNNKTIVLTLNDVASTEIVIPVEDLVDTNNYVSNANLLNDVLTLEREGLSDLTVDLASLKYTPEVRKYVDVLTLTQKVGNTINHNLNDEDVIVQVINNMGELIIPDKIHKYQSNSVVIEVSITGDYKVIIIK